jgi:hypothetical protein
MGAAARDGAAASPLLGPLLERLPEVFDEEVLKKWLDPTDCALLARACWRWGDTEAAPLTRVVFFRSGALLAWAKDNGCPWDVMDRYSVCKAAARGGHLEALQWALEQGDCTMCQLTCSNAVLGGHLDVLRWAREHGCPWFADSTSADAARYGHLKFLQWALANGCTWNDKRICESAAEGGHLDVLRWARENGCPWDHQTCLGAARGGHVEVLRWALDHHCPWGHFNLLYCCAALGRGGDAAALHMLQWLREYGFPGWNGNSIRASAAEHGHVEVLRWLDENDFHPWTVPGNRWELEDWLGPLD